MLVTWNLVGKSASFRVLSVELKALNFLTFSILSLLNGIFL